jgi:ribonuclease HI
MMRKRLRELRSTNQPLTKHGIDLRLEQTIHQTVHPTVGPTARDEADMATVDWGIGQPIPPELGAKVNTKLKTKLKELDKRDASYVVQKHRARIQRLADNNLKLGNKIMTGQAGHSNKYTLRILKDGDTLLTKPDQVKHKCFTNLQSHHQTPPPTRPIQVYPWEEPGALDKFRLETAAHKDPQELNLRRRIQDKVEFHRCINSLSNGKTPGPDEVPNEIIQTSPQLLKDCLYMLIQIMWATGCTPDKWKESNTILLFKNKGTILELEYYRRIGLENTLYKVWTKIVQGAMAAYAEQHRLLSQEQGGFRAHRNTIHQLETHTMILEDARLTGQDLFLVMVDLKEAFDTIDHSRMLKIVKDLGYPADVIQVIQGLYSNAYTKVQTPYGPTEPIKIQRGTLQGDSLSPFLFILYLEPLLRWLKVGAKGYHPGVFKAQHNTQIISSSAYADDLTIYTGSQSHLSLQMDKVSHYCTWAGLIISHSKTLATTALYRRLPQTPWDPQTARRILGQLQLQQQPVKVIDPQTPYKLLGVWFTMDLRWTKQMQETAGALRVLAKHLGNSYGTQTQKLRTLQTCLQAKARYAFPLMCYSDKDIACLDKIMDQVVRRAYKLPPGTPTAFLREDINRGGLGHTSLAVAYTTTAIKNLTQAYADEGQRGQLTRSLLTAQHAAFTHPKATLGGWIPDYSLRIRQLFQGAQADIHMTMQGSMPFELPDTAITQTILGQHPGVDTANKLHPIRKPLQKLWEIGIHSISQILTRDGTRVLTYQEIARNQAVDSSLLQHAYKRALQRITDFLAGPSPSTTKASRIPPREVHPSHKSWIQAMARRDRQYMSPPPSIQDLLSRLPAGLHQGAPGFHIHCGAKRKHKRQMNPEFREADANTYEQCGDPHPDRADASTMMSPTHVTAQVPLRSLDVQTGPGTCVPLTRLERAKRMLAAKIKPVEVYNQLCAYKDKVQEVPGEWRVRTQHRGTKLPKRKLVHKQIQWKVLWEPTILEGWEKDIAIDHLKYTPLSIRPATRTEVTNRPNAICEHCHEGHHVIQCIECWRGYHPQCQSSVPANGKCSQCHQSQQWRCPSKQAKYRQDTQHWYIEWEPQWEEEQQLRILGYGDTVDDTLHKLRSPQSPPPKPPKDAHLSNLEKQGNDGPRYDRTVGDPVRDKCSFSTEDTDPHTDIVGTGQYEMQQRSVFRRHTLQNGHKVDSNREMVTIHDPTGRTVGMLHPDRAQLLHKNYTRSLQGNSAEVQKLQPQSFAEEVARLLNRYKEGTHIPGLKRKVNLNNHWATPQAIYQALQDHIPQLTKERYASPLNYHPGMQQYWSCFERDQLFGALHNAYSCRWTGYSVANPEYDSKEMYKAVSWAVHSSLSTEIPTLTIFILPAWKGGSNTAYLKWIHKRPDVCRMLATIPRKNFKFIPPQANTMGLDAQLAGHPHWDVNILMVGNHQGYDTMGLQQDTQALTSQLQQAVTEAINGHVHNSPPLTWTQIIPHSPQDQDRSQTHGTTTALDPLLFRTPKHLQALPEDQAIPWKVATQEGPPPPAEHPLQLSPKPLKYNWKDFVYTDGSQKKMYVEGGLRGTPMEITVIGSGLYVPAQETAQERRLCIKATSPGNNTAYRAELVAILGALKAGYTKIMTDSVNSIYSIKAVLYAPAKVRFHRHIHLLEEIKGLIMAAEGNLCIMKIRAHAGLPGNEWADDLAAQAAMLGKADLDFSDVDSNNRPMGLWPKQKIWEPDLAMGERLHWHQVENLTEALTNRTHRVGTLRLGQADTSTVYYHAMQKIMPCIAIQYMDTWYRQGGITEGMKNTRIKYLTGQLPTAKNLARYKILKSPMCPCCKKHPDSGHHAVAWCPALLGMVQDKHNAAVRIITKAIAEGDKGAHHIVYNDGGAKSKWETAGMGDLYRTLQDIPADLLSQEELKKTGSRPDIILYRRTHTKRSPTGRKITKPAEIIVVEVKFVRDSDPTSTAKNPCIQHQRLMVALGKKHPQATISQSTILLGVAGTVYNPYTIQPLERVGVKGLHQKRTVLKLQTLAINELHATWKQRQTLIHRNTQQGPNSLPLSKNNAQSLPKPDAGLPRCPSKGPALRRPKKTHRHQEIHLGQRDAPQITIPTATPLRGGGGIRGGDFRDVGGGEDGIT